MKTLRSASLTLAVFFGAALESRGIAQETQVPTPQSGHAHSGETVSLPNLTVREGWPEPTADDAIWRYAVFELAEFQRRDSAPDVLRWDQFGWRGGDVHRFWFKSEGRIASDSSEESEIEAQALYGKLVTPLFDLQAGLRVARRLREGRDTTRVYAVIGVQGVAPYRFEIEPSLFISNKGDVSARFTGGIDLIISQRLILQPRLETNLAAEADEALGIGAGWNDAELGLRLRYEVRRELGWYFGVSRKKSFGETRRLAAQANEDTSESLIVAGVRAWF
jgi:copper resistance protein B